MNVQRSGLRSSGDLTATISLDELVKSEDVPGTVALIDETIDKLLEFLEDGELIHLTRSEFRLKAMEYIPVRLRDFSDAFFAAVSTQHLNVDKIGSKNVRRLKAFLKGAKNGLKEYKVEDRPDPGE